MDELGGGPRRSVRPTVARGRISRAPEHENDGLEVVLINYSALSPYEVPAENWIARGALPAVNDLCLVVFDDDGDAWAQIGSAA